VIYLDTSALIKRFVEEKGSARVHSMVASGEAVATAKIAYAETFAGLTRKMREDNLDNRQYDLACRQFEADWRAYIRVELTDDLLYLARDLIRRHGLRGFDAVHLASALTLKNAIDESVAFAAADRRLLRAADGEGLTAINVET
jgi:predicted nucleic acid-binding protein